MHSVGNEIERIEGGGVLMVTPHFLPSRSVLICCAQVRQYGTIGDSAAIA